MTDTTNLIDDSKDRAAFEKWILDNTHIRKDEVDLVERFPDTGHYKWQTTYAGWKAWQAALSYRDMEDASIRKDEVSVYKTSTDEKHLHDVSASSAKFSPCPFCGCSEITLEYIEPHTHKLAIHMLDHKGSAFVSCVDCGTVSGGYETKEKAIEAWNARYHAHIARIRHYNEFGEWAAAGELPLQQPSEG